MISGLINLMLVTVCIYIGIYTMYYAISVYFASKSRRLISKQKYFIPPYDNNIIVIVYTQNNQGDVLQLVEVLNKQKYPSSNFQVHVILDNCDDEISNKLEFVGGSKIWRLGDGVSVGRDEAVSWLLERLVSLQNVNAFVFLDSKRQVDVDFLTNVNKALFTQDVIVTATELVDNKVSLSSKIKRVYNKYHSNVNLTARTLMGLSTQIDSSACVIKQEVIEQIRCVDFKDINSELKYTTLLLKSGFNSFYNPTVKTKLKMDDYVPQKPSIAFRFELLKHCFLLFFKSRPQFTEFVLFNLKPNIWFVVFAYIVIMYLSSKYLFFNGFDAFNLVLSFALILLISFAASLFVSKIDKKYIRYLLLYPFFKTCKNFENSDLAKMFENLGKKKALFVNRDMVTVSTTVTDGKNSLDCSLDLISEDGFAKAVFRYKKKIYSSSKQLRMVDAISEVVKKLDEHGFRLKICHTCGYFTPLVDGTTNMIKGECFKSKISSPTEKPQETLVWSMCENYIPKEINKIVSMDEYRNQ